MSESKLKRNRHCRNCKRDIYGSAEKLKEHVALHRFAARSGLTVVERGVIAPGIVDAKGTEVKHGN